MKHKAKHDYKIFTRDELAVFMEKHESDFRYIESPFDIIVEQKMDAVMQKIDKNLENGKKIREEYERTNDGFKYMTNNHKNNEEWQRLDKEYDKLSKLRFGS